MLDNILEQSIIGVDTESDSLYVYHEKVCLIQLSTSNTDYLVDPLKINNLHPLNDVFFNEKIEKIFHAAEYDIMCLKRDFNFQFSNIFDTMIASRILSKNKFGLSNLLNEYFDLEINKKYQRANWGRRPLSEEMINYASVDSHYLIALRNILHRDLISKNLFDLAQEDFNRICNVESFQAHKTNDVCWKMVKGNHLSLIQMTVLMELCNLRENLAKNKNIPAFKVIGPEVLIEIAKNCPKSIQNLSEIKGVSAKLINKYGNDLIKCVQIGLVNQPVSRQHKIKPSEAYMLRYESLKNWRKNKANNLGVESDVILPKDLIDIISTKNPNSTDELIIIMHEVPYRFNRYGNEILELLANLGG
jgi:ribonuclease D